MELFCDDVVVSQWDAVVSRHHKHLTTCFCLIVLLSSESLQVYDKREHAAGVTVEMADPAKSKNSFFVEAIMSTKNMHYAKISDHHAKQSLIAS